MNVCGSFRTIGQRNVGGFILTNCLNLEVIILSRSFTLVPTSLFASDVMAWDGLRIPTDLVIIHFVGNHQNFIPLISDTYLFIWGTFSSRGRTPLFATLYATLLAGILLIFISYKHKGMNKEKMCIVLNSMVRHKSNEEN